MKISSLWSLLKQVTALSVRLSSLRLACSTKSSYKIIITFLKYGLSLTEYVDFTIVPLFNGSLYKAHFSISGPIIPNVGISTALP